MGYVNWLWGGDETHTELRPTKIELRDQWFGGITLVKVPDVASYRCAGCERLRTDCRCKGNHEPYDQDGGW
jgi:hypothetical protein